MDGLVIQLLPGHNVNMALTYTPTPALGSPCPDFSLPTVDGKTLSLSDLKSAKAIWVMFICNHCPYVKAVEDRLIQLNLLMESRGVASVAICSNDAKDHPEDAPKELLKRWLEKDYGFPYLIDESQDVARAFGAVCTPDFFVYDGDRRLAYRGRLDDSWKDPTQVKTFELKTALESIVSGKPVNLDQNSSMGCSIKWKSGD